MSTPEQELHQQLIIANLNAHRPGARLRIHIEDLYTAVPESFIELRKVLGHAGTQLINIALMNDWLKSSGYRLKTITVEHDEHGSWAVIEKTA